MKGFLMKDFRITLQQKRYFIMILVIGLILSAGVGSMFVVGYLTMVGSFFTIATIGYDELDHGMNFLLSLPAGRKKYIQEKYLFGIILSAIMMGVSLILKTAASLLQQEAIELPQFLTAAGAIYLATLVMMAIILPFVVRMGGEKGRTAAIGVFLALFGGGYALLRAFPQMLGKVQKLAEAFFGSGMIAAGIVILSAAAVYALSCAISITLINKKEY